MATTNDPLQGGPTPGPNPGADPVNVLAPKAPGQPSHDDHDTSGPPAPEVIKRGYEEDVYDTKTVLSVPLLVILFFVLAFGTVTVLFSIYSKPTVDPAAHPAAKARNEEELNKRLGHIGRGKEIDQPRLEPLKLRAGDSRAITRPELSVQEGNSPELHPEDLIPNKDRYPELYAAGGTALDKTLGLSDDELKALPAFKSSGLAAPHEAGRQVSGGASAGRGPDALPPKPFDAKKSDPKTPTPAPTPKEKGKEGKS